VIDAAEQAVVLSQRLATAEKYSLLVKYFLLLVKYFLLPAEQAAVLSQRLATAEKYASEVADQAS